MYRGSRYLTLLLALPTLVALGGCGASGNEESGQQDFRTSLQMGTASPGGVYFPLGTQYATILEGKIDVEGLSVTAVETEASVENIANVERGENQLGIAQNNVGINAVNGEGEFEGAEVTNVGLMGSLYPETLHVITLESTGIESIADLEGKTIAIGPPGSGSNVAAKQLLSAYGINDYDGLSEGFQSGRSKLRDRNIDAVIEIMGVPYSGIQELAATNDAKLIPIDDSQLQSILDQTNYEEYVIDPGIYDFLDEPVQTLSAFACMFGSTTQISEELGYKITKTMYESSDQLTLPQKQVIGPQNALLGRGQMPLHPGARRYFQEEGLQIGRAHV